MRVLVLVLVALVLAVLAWTVVHRSLRGTAPEGRGAHDQVAADSTDARAVGAREDPVPAAQGRAPEEDAVRRDVLAGQEFTEPVLRAVDEAGRSIPGVVVEAWSPETADAATPPTGLGEQIETWRRRAEFVQSSDELPASGELSLSSLRGLGLIVRAPGRSPEAIFVPPIPVSQTVVLEQTPGFRGRVVDARTDAPVAGAVLFAHPHLRTGESSASQRILHEVFLAVLAVTGSDGRFVLDQTRGGHNEMWCQAAGYPTTYLACAEPSEQEISIRLSAGGGLSGIVVDEEGNPLAGVLVGSAQRGARPVVAVETYSDERGEWSLESISEGFLSVSAHKDGYGAWKQFYDERSVPPDYLELVLAPQASCSGVVLDEDGAPIAGALVQVLDATIHADLGEFTTEADGRWYFHWARAGDYLQVYVGKAGFATVYYIAATAPLEDYPIVLSRPHTVSGRIRDPSGTPIPKATLRVVALDENGVDEIAKRDAPEFVTVDDPGGEFQFSWLPGPFELTVRAPGCRTLIRQDLVLPRGMDLGPLDLELVLGAALQGRVLDAGGNPIAGVTVSLSDSTTSGLRLASPFGSVQTGVDGGFALDNPPEDPFALWLACADQGRLLVEGLRSADFPRDFVLEGPGSCRLSASARGHAAAGPETLTLVAGSQIRRTLVLPRLGALEVLVLRSADRPVARVPVELGRGREVRGSLLTDTDGQVLFADLEPGDYTIRSTEGQSEGAVLPGEVTELVIRSER